MEKKVIDDMSGPKERVVIFAEGNSDDVFMLDGLPAVKKSKRQDHFANAARDFIEANPQYEYMVVTGSGKGQLEKAFHDVAKSGFMDGNTRLMVMGHASPDGEFGGVDPSGWSTIIRDAGLKDSFKEVAYGACSQGNFGVCVDLSRSFGKNTTVYAQVGQKWGEPDTPNSFLNRMEAEGKTSKLHKRPETFEEAFRTVGSGLMTYKGAERTYTPGSTQTVDPYNVENLPFKYQHREGMDDVALLNTINEEDRNRYLAQEDSIKAEYNIPRLPNPDSPKYRIEGDYKHYKQIRGDTHYETQLEFFKEKHGREPNDDEIHTWQEGSEGSKRNPLVNLKKINMSERDQAEYINWLDDKGDYDSNPDIANAWEDLSAYSDGNGPGPRATWNVMQSLDNDYLAAIAGNKVRNQYTDPALMEDPGNIERKAAYDAEFGRVSDIRAELGPKQKSAIEGLAPVKIDKREHFLLDTDKEINFPTLEDMIKNPDKVVSLYIKEENMMEDRQEAFYDLYMSGNKAAENALRVAHRNLDSQDVITEEKDPAQWQRALDLEALRVYSESDESDFTGWDQLLGDY